MKSRPIDDLFCSTRVYVVLAVSDVKFLGGRSRNVKCQSRQDEGAQFIQSRIVSLYHICSHYRCKRPEGSRYMLHEEHLFG